MLSKNKERKLIELYPHTDNADIAKILGITLWVVKKVSEELGLEKEEQRKWTDMDIWYIKEMYPDYKNKYIAENLGRTKMEIEHFAFRMGLSKSQDFFSNILITTEEKDLLKQWNDEYNKIDYGYSRGNYVLGKILEQLFPHSQIIPEYPIGSLKLDYYIQRVSLGFEFDGIQHREYNNFFYETKADFIKAQNRDYKKSDMCESMGIAIVRFAHDENLTISLTREKIGEVM